MTVFIIGGEAGRIARAEDLLAMVGYQCDFARKRKDELVTARMPMALA
jgi:hypothetical protein